jgi:hypothetical protein
LSVRFLFDWDEAANSPKRTLAATFLIVAPALAAISYVTVAQHVLFAALAIGIFGGAFFTIWCAGEIKQRAGTATKTYPRRRMRYVRDATLVAPGLIVVLVGVATTRLVVILSGLPLLVLAVSLIFLRRRFARSD